MAVHAGGRRFVDEAVSYHEFVRAHLAEVAGALPQEVVAMNTLTANLHFLMVSFYRPTAERPAILIEAGAFPEYEL